MKYSLRRLMLVVTLICVLLGGRIEYLRRWAIYHEQESLLAAQKIQKVYGVPDDKIKDFLDPSDPFFSHMFGKVVKIEWPSGETYSATIDENFRAYDRHRKLADAFRAAAYRPWRSVPEPAPLP